MAEQMQENSSDNKSITGHNTQNQYQQFTGHTGDRRSDLSNTIYEDNEYLKDIKWSDVGNEEWWDSAKYKTGESLTGASKWMDLMMTAASPMAYIKGGDHSFMGKLKAYEDEDSFGEVTQFISQKYNIPNSFLSLMETPSSTLANMGETSEDKLVAIQSGIYDLTRFISFRIQDLTNHFGADEDSIIGKTDALMTEVELKKDSRNQGIKNQFLDWAGESSLVGLLGAGVGAAVLGGLGGAVSGGAAIPALITYMAYKNREKEKAAGNIMNTKEALYGDDRFGELYETDFDGNGKLDAFGEPILLKNGIDDSDEIISGEILPESTPSIGFNDLYEYIVSIEENTFDTVRILSGSLSNGTGGSVDENQLKLIQEREKEQEEKRSNDINSNIFLIKKYTKEISKYTNTEKQWDDRFENLLDAIDSIEAGGYNGDGGYDGYDGYGDSSSDKKKKKKKNKNKNKNKRRSKRGMFNKIKNMPKIAPGGLGIASKGFGLASKVALPLAVANVGYEGYNAAVNDEPMSYASMGTMAGAAIGGAVGFFGGMGVGAVPGAELGSLAGAAIGTGIEYVAGPRTKPTLDEVQKEKDKENFEKKHEQWFNWIDDGKYINGAYNKVLFRHDDGSIWDVATNKKIGPSNKEKFVALAKKRAQQKTKNMAIVPDTQNIKKVKGTKNTNINVVEKPEITSAEKYLQEKSKDIQDSGGKNQDPNKIDTEDEMKGLLHAIWQDQQAVGQMSVEESGKLLESINTLISVISGGNSAMHKALKEISIPSKDPVAPRPDLGNH